MDPVSMYQKKPSFFEKFTEADLKSSQVWNFFRGKVFFITGGTGFLGQLYIEKLLRCDVKRVYMLARPKKDKTPEERIQEIFSGVQFSVLRKHDPDFMKRVTIVEGDLAEDGVGINEKMLNILREEVDSIIHAGADVRFQEKLIKLVLINLRGTRELLRLAMTFKKLQLFTYISTAYSNCPAGSYIHEKFYDYPIDPDTMITLAERLQNNESEMDRFETITERIILPWPNTYTYTKSLSEEMIRRHGEKMRTIVIRPSIVISTCQEPVPGWSNNIYGYNGILVAAGMGFIRTVPIDGDKIANLVCADYVINVTLAAIWATDDDDARDKQLALPPSTDTKIYAVCTSKDRPVTWRDTCEYLFELFTRYPTIEMVWITVYTLTTCPVLQKYYYVMFHFLPGFATDIVLKLAGKKERLLPNYRKVQVFLSSLKYFMQYNWIFDNTNTISVMNRMTAMDQKLFISDVRKFDFIKWAAAYAFGLKVYLIKAKVTDEVFRIARKKYFRLRIVHVFVQIGYYAVSSLLIYGAAKGLGLVNYIQSIANDC